VADDIDIKVVNINTPSRQMMCTRHPGEPIIWNGHRPVCAECEKLRDYVVRRFRETFEQFEGREFLPATKAAVVGGANHEYLTLTILVEPERGPRRCQERESGGIQCCLPAGHEGRHQVDSG
jgi:hypothetical protein